MIQKIKSYLLMASSVLLIAVPLAVPAMVSADVCGNDTIGKQLNEGANRAATNQAGPNCSDPSGVSDSSIGAIGHKIVNTISIVIGVIAIIMIIFGGFRYITSGGDSGRVGNAKNTLIYAIVGLIIVAMAQIIVHFVLNQTNSAIQ